MTRMPGGGTVPAMNGSRPRAERRKAAGHAVFRICFVPLLLLGALTPWIAFSRATGWTLTPRTRPEATAPVLLMVMLFVWLAEQVYPQNADWNAHLLTDGTRGWRRLGRDLFYLLGVAQLTALAIAALDPRLESAAGALRLRLGAGQPWWPTGAPFAARAALAFGAVELCSYWIHRAAHRFLPLWQFHSTHHVITELNGLKSVRTHPVDNLVFHVGRVAPLVVLGAGPDELLAAIYLGGVFGILAHANVSVSDRFLGLFFNLPRCHAVHHSSLPTEANKNFGCHTVLWDRVFGTFQRAPAAPLTLGVVPVGPRSLWQELAWPFYRAVSAPAPGPPSAHTRD